MEMLGTGSVALAVMVAEADGVSQLSAAVVVSVEAVGSTEAVVSAGALTSVAAGGWAAGRIGCAMGDRETSRELSLTRLVESEPQPPRTHARTATTRTCGQTPELERTVSPLFSLTA